MSTTVMEEREAPSSVAAALLPIMGVVFVAFLVIGIAMPVLPIHVHDRLGLGTFAVGLVAGSQFAASLMSRPWAGHCSDGRGAKRGVIVGLPAAAASGMLYLLSLGFTAAPLSSVSVLLLGRGLLGGGPAVAQEASIEGGNPMSKPEDIRAVAPALESYTQRVVLGDLWKRPGLSDRDRSIVTVAALIARNQAVELPYYLGLALDTGVKPSEISEIITHLAFYTGWANAMDAIPAARDVFKSRSIGADQLPTNSGPQLPLDEAAEKQRATRVGEQFGQITPSLVQYTTDVLFRDLWLRPALAPRDRSLVTVSALIATGQVAQITYHLNRAMDNGLTREEAGEVLGHLAFYAGWPNAFSAAPVVKEVIEKRPH